MVMHTEKQQAAAAKRFAEKWQGKGYEKGDSQIFWTELLTEVYGISDPSTFIRFEKQVKVDKTNFIDVHLPSTIERRNNCNYGTTREQRNH